MQSLFSPCTAAEKEFQARNILLLFLVRGLYLSFFLEHPMDMSDILKDPFFFFLINLFNLFIFGCVGSSLLQRAFSSCCERGLLLVAVRGLLTAVASLVAEHGV